MHSPASFTNNNITDKLLTHGIVSLGLMRKRIVAHPDIVNLKIATLVFIDISSGLARGINNKSTYLNYADEVKEYHNAAFSKYDIVD